MPSKVLARGKEGAGSYCENNVANSCDDSINNLPFLERAYMIEVYRWESRYNSKNWGLSGC
jgi:hypothetical protein